MRLGVRVPDARSGEVILHSRSPPMWVRGYQQAGALDVALKTAL
jgi:hypothetical protein